MQLWAVVDEAVIRRQIGGTAVMRAQLERLAQASASPHIKLQVVPFAAGAHPGMPGSFAIMEFANPSDAPLVYTDGIMGDAFLEGPEDIARISAVFEDLTARALNASQSKRMIQEAARAT